MTKLLLLSFILFFSKLNAATYYFASNGSDANNGTSTGTPWQTVAKFNSVFASRAPGDFMLFRKGDTFVGSLNINRGGTLASRITIGAYGTGANPIITGFATISAWTSLGSNIWESTSAVTTLTSLNMVVINGVNTAMGRFPNTGYLTYTGTTATTKNVAGLPSSTTNWTGATAVMRLHHWITDMNTITAHSGTTITHTVTANSTTYNGINGYGLFIQNDVRTLDAQNEWFFNPSTKKLRIYSTSSPTGVQVTVVDTLVKMPKVGSSGGNITFENIQFVGANKNHFTINAVPNLTIQNCQFDYCGKDAIWGGQNWGSPFSPNFIFKNSSINRTNNNAILLRSEFTSALIQFDTIKNTALIPGAGVGGDGQMMAVRIQAHGATIEKNIIDSTGYIAIYFKGNNAQISYNYINEYNRTKMDGGGVYTWRGSEEINTGCRIHHNIIINSNPSTAGTTQANGLSHGIYMDANTENIQIDSNSVANMGYACLYIYSGASNNNIFGNKFYNATVTQFLTTNQFTNGRQTKNNTLRDNIFVARASTQKVHTVTTKYTLSEYTDFMGTRIGNYYCRPIDDITATNTFLMQSSGGFNNWSLANWKTTTTNDVGSKKSPQGVTSVNNIRFEYNNTFSDKVISLPGLWRSMKNGTYNGEITLKPFTSNILIQ